ncbi:MAG TPA: DUF507 family protein [Bdellovibrionales bacterium]|nr:DUF507 family protein [Bdellovibrionales bacterium]
MILSEERQTRFAHIIVDGIWDDDLVDYSDDELAIRAAKKAVIKFVQQEGEIDERVRAKLLTLKRGLVEGSPEWDVMYRKYYEEEMKRSGNV